ncbi:MAG: hypothetical protein Q8O00_12720, partial [Holophaga sp.]|nr:hypothetical protein [Holophaga sp.]
LRLDVAQRGKFYSPWGIDYFVFPRHLYTQVPNFTIGRPAWDNWMVYQAKAEGRPVVDLSPMLAAVHQNHDFNHLPGGEATYRNGSESLANRQMAGGYFHLLNLEDATHVALQGCVRRRWWRFSTRIVTRWALGLTTRHPWLRDRLRSLKRRLQGRLR